MLDPPCSWLRLKKGAQESSRFSGHRLVSGFTVGRPSSKLVSINWGRQCRQKASLTSWSSLRPSLCRLGLYRGTPPCRRLGAQSRSGRRWALRQGRVRENRRGEWAPKHNLVLRGVIGVFPPAHQSQMPSGRVKQEALASHGRAERSAYPLVILSSPRGARRRPCVSFLAEGREQLRQSMPAWKVGPSSDRKEGGCRRVGPRHPKASLILRGRRTRVS